MHNAKHQCSRLVVCQWKFWGNPDPPGKCLPGTRSFTMNGLALSCWSMHWTYKTNKSVLYLYIYINTRHYIYRENNVQNLFDFPALASKYKYYLMHYCGAHHIQKKIEQLFRYHCEIEIMWNSSPWELWSKNIRFSKDFNMQQYIASWLLFVFLPAQDHGCFAH